MSTFFSVVIPTHNGLDLLRDAIETVTLQNYENWELVIFDNASSEDISGHVKSLGHPNIRYERSNEFLPVTDSWNNAINLAQGQYVTLFGNDDGLAPGYFNKVDGIIRQFGGPDLLYSGIYQFMYPGVMPSQPKGYVMELKNGFFFAGRNEPFLLPREEISKAVRGSVSLRRNFGLGMQVQCYSRDFIKRLRAGGPLFRSPFPDYYLVHVAFATARSMRQ